MYQQGAYGRVVNKAARAAKPTATAPVYIGAAPVHLTRDGAKNLNQPTVIRSFAEACQTFGYSDDWASYPLCEAMYVHFVLCGISPLVLINVFDVEAAKESAKRMESLTPENGRVTIPNAENVIMDSVTITGKALGTDYNMSYDYQKKLITIAQTVTGSLGTAALAISMDTVDAATEADVIGATDGEGVNTGLYTLLDVYIKTGLVPSYILAPGYSQVKEVRDVMAKVSRQIDGHWDAHIFTDLPLVDGSEPMTLTKAAAWKQMNGYTADNEKVHFPKYKGTDGRVYHLSVLEAAVKQELDNTAEGIPYLSASNKELPVSGMLYFGEDTEIVPGVETINQKLCQHGITSAAFVAGRWGIWGAHAASYAPDNDRDENRADVALMMLFHVSNDFQRRRGMEIGQQMTKNRVEQIIAEEKSKLDGLKALGAIMYGDCYVADADETGLKTDYAKGDVIFRFEVTTTPLCKSLTALVSYTDAGLTVYKGE